MKALTLWQPWASAIAWRLKTIETRSWSTRYRGPLAIHAARIVPRSAALSMQALELLEDNHIVPPLPAGCIVATCDLLDVVRVEDMCTGGGLRRSDLLLGDFSPGRFAWILGNVVRLEPPAPAVGARALWEWVPVCAEARP